MNDKTYKILFIMFMVLGVVFTIIGATFAYYTATVKSNNTIGGTTYNFNMGLDISTIRSGDLIPVVDNVIDESLASNYKCIDERDYGLCSLYKVRFTNNSTTETLVGYLKTLSGTTYISNNLRYRLYEIKNGNYVPVSDIRTVSVIENIENYFINDSANLMITVNGNSDKEYYLAIWIHDTGTNQLEDQGKAYVGRVEFTSSNGGMVSADFTS